MAMLNSQMVYIYIYVHMGFKEIQTIHRDIHRFSVIAKSHHLVLYYIYGGMYMYIYIYMYIYYRMGRFPLVILYIILY